MGVALLLGGCAVGGGGDEDEFGLPDDKAVAAQRLPVDADAGGTATSTTAAPGQAGGPTTTANRGGTTTITARRASSGGGSGATTTTTTVPYAERLTVADRTGDLEGISVRTPPAYADLARLRLEDDGTRARFTVDMAADVPAALAEGEQVAVGIDLFRGEGTESEYQLYARGDAEGWRAWLQTPSGFVEYPGTFEVGADRLVHTVPWSSLGGRRPGALSVFAEWERAGAAAVADERKDRAPDRGSQSFSF